MTAVWRSGAEIAPHTAETEFSAGDFTYASQVITPVHRGTYALKFAGSGYAMGNLGTGLSGVAVRAYLLRDTATLSGSAAVLGLLPSSSDFHLAHLRLKSDYTLELRVNGLPGTLVATSSFTVPLDTWAYLELWLDRGQQIIATRYNGTEWARTTFAPTGGAASDVGYFYVGPADGLTGCNFYYDDMACNSLAGPTNNGWPGPSDGGVLTFRPTATQSPAGWTSQGAPTGHECLDDLAPDGFTTFIEETTGGLGLAMALIFPAWPVVVPAACLMIGLVGSGAAGTTLNVQIHDPADVPTIGAVTLEPGWQRRYPALTAERAWDGSRRLLNNGYLMPSSGTQSRVIIVRADALPNTQFVTTLWMTADFPLALAAAPSPTEHFPTMLATIAS